MKYNICPFCKIDFRQFPHYADGQPKVICLNCRYYYEAKQNQNKYDSEMETATKINKEIAADRR